MIKLRFELYNIFDLYSENTDFTNFRICDIIFKILFGEVDEI